MTIEVVKERLDTLLSESQPRVVLLTGGWGAGKTYQWKAARRRAAAAGNRPRYAYVSLFGLTSLAEVRKRIAEETVSAISIPGQEGTLGDEMEAGGWQLKPMQIIKLLPVIPYLAKLEGLANELSFSSVRNAVVCFDDLERGGPGLRIADVFGLACFLKEERNCRIVLISNQDKLDPQGKDDLLLYLEKVTDEVVHFAPTPIEACGIALGESHDAARVALREAIVELGISNIRVISRLSAMAAELAAICNGLEAGVLKEGIRALALFGAAHFLQGDRFPSVAHLMNLENEWIQYFQNAKKEGEETPEQTTKAAWRALLERYGYGATSPFDAEIGQAVKQGYFDHRTLLPLAKELSDTAKAQAIRADYHDAWSRFWHSLNGEGEELLRDLRNVTMRSLDVIGLGDFQQAYEVYVRAGQPDVATELLDAFIVRNRHRPAVFHEVDGTFRGNYKGPFADRIRAESEKHRAPASIEEALDRIDFEQGWNPDDVRIVGMADAAEIERLLRTSEGRLFRRRIRTLLRLGTLGDAQESEKGVSALTTTLLKKLADDDPVIGIRMRQYMPADDNAGAG